MKASIDFIEETHPNFLIQLFRQRYHNLRLNIQDVTDYGELEELLSNALYDSLFFKRCFNEQELTDTKLFWGKTFPFLGYSFKASILKEGATAKITLDMPEYMLAQVMSYMLKDIDADEECNQLIKEYGYPVEPQFDFAAMY